MKQATLWTAVGGVGLLGLGTLAGWVLRPVPSTGSIPAYGANPSASHSTRLPTAPATAATVRAPAPDPLAAYRRGDYPGVERAARAVLSRPATTGAERTRQLKARRLMAFAAARQGDLARARAGFGALIQEARSVPDARQSRPGGLGVPAKASVEEDAAYQHAVCTAALGDKEGAEREYIAFLKNYPYSPLIHGAIKRIARLHESRDIPQAAEAAWLEAMERQKQKAREERRAQALCGPQCVAELLRRRGKTAGVEQLARSMGTSETGTSMLAMQKALRGAGYTRAQGVAVSLKGLEQQKLPLVVLLQPGHYIVLDRLSRDSATVWEQGMAKTLPRSEFVERWAGAFQKSLPTFAGPAITLSEPVGVQTAQVGH